MNDILSGNDNNLKPLNIDHSAQITIYSPAEFREISFFEA